MRRTESARGAEERNPLARIPFDRAGANGYAFLTEMLFQAARAGIRIGEVPIVFVERLEGYSKVSSAVLMESLMTPWRLIARHGRLNGAASTSHSAPTSTPPGSRP